MFSHNLYSPLQMQAGSVRVVGPSTRWYSAPSPGNCLWTPAHCRQWAAIFQTTFFAWFVTRAKRPGISINVSHFIICHSDAPHFVIVSTWLRPILIDHYHSWAPYWDMTLHSQYTNALFWTPQQTMNSERWTCGQIHWYIDYFGVKEMFVQLLFWERAFIKILNVEINLLRPVLVSTQQALTDRSKI